MVGQEGKVAASKHLGSKISHDRLGLYMQVSQHLVGAPAPEETNAISIDVCAQECHGAGRSKGAGGDVGGEETVGRTKQTGGQTEKCRELGRFDAAEGG